MQVACLALRGGSESHKGLRELTLRPQFGTHVWASQVWNVWWRVATVSRCSRGSAAVANRMPGCGLSGKPDWYDRCVKLSLHGCRVLQKITFQNGEGHYGNETAGRGHALVQRADSGLERGRVT